MKTESEQLLSLLVDGEQVDPDALASALAEPDAAKTLIEYERVHRAAAADDARPSDAFYARMRREMAAAGHRSRAWRAPLAAAAAIVLSALGGAWFGWSLVPARTVTMPVVVQQSVPRAYEPRATPPQTAPISAPADCSAPGPPKPDRIIQLTVATESRSIVSGGGNQP